MFDLFTIVITLAPTVALFSWLVLRRSVWLQSFAVVALLVSWAFPAPIAMIVIPFLAGFALGAFHDLSLKRSLWIFSAAASFVLVSVCSMVLTHQSGGSILLATQGWSFGFFAISFSLIFVQFGASLNKAMLRRESVHDRKTALSEIEHLLVRVGAAQ